MAQKKEFNGTIYWEADEDTAATLKHMASAHGVTPVEVTRRLLLAACQFYREHGWFSFPVVIEPEAFQARYVAEAQAAYGEKPRKKSAGRGGAAKG